MAAATLRSYMSAAVESLQQGQRVRVDAPGVPEFATVRFVTPADADGVAAFFLADDAGAVHEVRVGPGQPASVRALVSDGSRRLGAGARRDVDEVDGRRGHQRRVERDRLHAASAVRAPDDRGLRRDAPAAAAAVPARRRTRHGQDDHGRPVPARDAAARARPARDRRLPGQPRIEVGRRLRAVLRRRPPPPHREHGPRGRGRLATTCGSSRSSWRP